MARKFTYIGRVKSVHVEGVITGNPANFSQRHLKLLHDHKPWLVEISDRPPPTTPTPTVKDVKKKQKKSGERTTGDGQPFIE